MRYLIGLVIAAAVVSPSAAADAPVMIGKWELMKVADPMTDETRAIGVLKGEGGALAIKCDKPGPDSIYIQVIFDDYMGGRGASSASRDFTYRFDATPPVTEGWRYDSSWAAQFDKKAAAAFAQRVSQSSKLVVRGISYNSKFSDATFDLAGANDLVSKVIEGCKAS